MFPGESTVPPNVAPMITVAQVIGSFDGGGAQRAALNLAEALRAHGCRSIAIALRSLGGFANEERTGIVTRSLGAGGFFASARAGWRLRRLVRSEKINIVHVHGSSSLLLVTAALLGLRRVKVAFTWHDSGSVLGGRGLKRWASRRSLDRCAAVFGSSSIVASKLESAWGGGRSVGVFYNGVPVTPERSGDSPVPVLLWMARFVPDKDPELLVRAAAALRDEGLAFRLILAGAPLPRHQWLYDRVVALINELRLTDVVQLPGWIKDTRTLVATSDVGVQTSHTEGLSMTLLEQMMAGLAVVATDVGETGYALDQGRCGVLISPRDLGGLVDALRTVIRDKDARAELGRSARERAIREFSLEAMAVQAMRAYAVAGRA